jgi:hypothetical protein
LTRVWTFQPRSCKHCATTLWWESAPARRPRRALIPFRLSLSLPRRQPIHRRFVTAFRLAAPPLSASVSESAGPVGGVGAAGATCAGSELDGQPYHTPAAVLQSRHPPRAAAQREAAGQGAESSVRAGAHVAVGCGAAGLAAVQSAADVVFAPAVSSRFLA